MPTSEFNNGGGAGFGGSNATFRAWVQAIHDALTATGCLVEVADSGDIADISTLVTPNSTSVQRGYKVYRFDDALQATAPVFVKIQYGSSNGGADYPGLWLKAGTTHDGAGGIGGQTFAESRVGYTGIGEINKIYANKDGLAIYFGAASANDLAGLMVVGRTRNAAGQATGDGFYYVLADNGNGVKWGVVPSAGSVPSQAASYGIFPSMDAHHTKHGTDVAVFRAALAALGKALGCHEVYAFKTADIGKHGAFTATVDGATKTLMPLSTCGGYPVSSGSPAIIFE